MENQRDSLTNQLQDNTIKRKMYKIEFYDFTMEDHIIYLSGYSKDLVIARLYREYNVNGIWTISEAQQEENNSQNIEDQLQETKEALSTLQRQVEQQQQQIERLLEHFEESQAPKREKIPLEKVPMSERLTTLLRNQGFDNFVDVFSFYQKNHDRGFLIMKNFGRKSLNEVKDLFKEYGFLEERNNVRW